LPLVGVGITTPTRVTGIGTTWQVVAQPTLAPEEGGAPLPTPSLGTTLIVRAVMDPGSTGGYEARITDLNGVSILALGDTPTVPSYQQASTAGQFESTYLLQVRLDVVGEVVTFFRADVVRDG